MNKKEFILGMGVGILISSILLLSFGYEKYNDFEIETKARVLGMKYIDEMKVLDRGELK